MLAKHPPLRAFGLGIDVDALVSLPDAGKTAQRPEIGKTVWRDVVGLGEDILARVDAMIGDL
jgi:hypothetical protein